MKVQDGFYNREFYISADDVARIAPRYVGQLKRNPSRTEFADFQERQRWARRWTDWATEYQDLPGRRGGVPQVVNRRILLAGDEYEVGNLRYSFGHSFDNNSVEGINCFYNLTQTLVTKKANQHKKRYPCEFIADLEAFKS